VEKLGNRLYFALTKLLVRDTIELEINAKELDDMTYVCSNIRGDFPRFMELFKNIKFNDDDIMYIVGDTIDFHEQSMPLICDLSMRSNVYPVMGAHELLALSMLKGFDNMLKNGKKPDSAYIEKMNSWMVNGGKTTFDGFRSLDKEMKEGVLDYLSEFAPYEEAFTDKNEYILVYSGISGFTAGRELDEYKPNSFIDCKKELSEAIYFKDKVVIIGYSGGGDKIKRIGKNIIMDCTLDDKIACLCLENNKEYYV